MQQLSLFHSSRHSVKRPIPLDEPSEGLLHKYRRARIAAGAHSRSVAREVSQLRSVAREAGMTGEPVPLAELVTDPELIARTLTEPQQSVARSTSRARLVAVQRFLAVMGSSLRVEPTGALRALDAYLPARASPRWNDTGVLLAGSRARRRRRAPSLDAVDLERIIAGVVDSGDPARTARNRALVALHCFSGLRVEEICTLEWSQLALVTTGRDGNRWTADVYRNKHALALPLLGPAANALSALAAHATEAWGYPSGPVFRTKMARPTPISYRTARDVVTRACAEVGLPAVESVSLRAAFAYWLRSRGLSDHEVAAVLGVERVRTVDMLLRQHIALNSQRQVREMQG